VRIGRFFAARNDDATGARGIDVHRASRDMT
jgi:hypothetical protein